MAKALASIHVLIDSREQTPWSFPAEEKRPGQVQILGSEIQGLDCGDYAIKEIPNALRIERKQGHCELFGNYSMKEHKERFERECIKLQKIDHKYILICTALTNDSLGLGVPQGYGPPGSRLLEWLIQIGLEYNVHVMYAGDAAQRVAKTIIKSVARKYL